MHILLDFDGTLTVRDTIGALARAAIAFQSGRAGGEARAVWAGRWQAIVDAYAADYQAHSAAYPAPAAAYNGTTAERRAYLDSLRAVERRSVQRVEAAGLFAGMGAAQLEAAGRRAVVDEGLDGEDKVELRRGAARLFAEAAARNWSVSIVSVNWSDAWVRGVLSAAVPGTAATVPILSNTTTATGGIVRNFHARSPGDGTPLLTAPDKLEAYLHAMSSTRRRRPLYVGDSLTDLDCLQRAACNPGSVGSGGIVMAENADSTLIRTLVELGERVPHILEPEATRFHVEGWELDTGPGCLSWARDFDEVIAWLFKEE